MNNTYNKETNKILKIAEKEMLMCHHPYVGTEHLLLSLLQNKNIQNICSKYNLTYLNYKESLLNIIGSSTKESKYILYTPLLKLVLNKAKQDSCKDNKELDEYYLLNSLLNYKDGIGCTIINGMGIDLDGILEEINHNKVITKYGINLNEKKHESIFLREKEINEIIEVLLRRNKNNPILVGPAGVGKTAIVEELASRIKNGKVPEALKNKVIISVSTSNLLAGTKYRGDFEEKINNLISEVQRNKDIILFIDEIHTIMKTGTQEGGVDAGNILKPYLASGEIKVIGATTNYEYNEYIKKDQALLRRFSKVNVKEPSLDQMKVILYKLKFSYEKYYGIKINKKLINYIVEQANSCFPNQYNPDKSIELLDTLCSRKLLCSCIGKNEVISLSKSDLDSLIREKRNIRYIDSNLIEKIRSELEESYNDKVIKSIINLIKDNKSNRYMYLNGSNKNKMKILNYIVDKLEVNKIVINCQEYSDDIGITKLINNNYLYDRIEEQPNSYIIIDNYDKCSKILYSYINGMIKNGYISNMDNERLYLTNNVIFILNNEESLPIGFTDKVYT